MKKEFVFLMFALCLAVWVIAVDNLIIPSMQKLRPAFGTYSRYRVKEWSGDGRFGVVKDKILIYAYVKDAEKFYYMDRAPHYEAALKQIEPGTPIELRYSTSFPKIWQRTLYEVRVGDAGVIRYSPIQLEQKQEFNWKFSGIMVGAFVLLSSLGLIPKPRRKKK